ncbi:ABC transporter permease [Mongoliimonas terrestris]|uniref:ABC transporter permease n=1 Tax=Mongoliimonas terrestris TaxID=1709001 RepID=UPI000949A2A3|nr:ABC transporter permease [Mongoliimonas terrestris]
MALAIDRLGAVTAALAAGAIALLPFATFRANRIVAGDPVAVWAALPPAAGLGVAAAVLALAAVALMRTPPAVRLAAAVAGLVLLLVAVGLAATHLTPEGDRYARVAPAAGFWTGLFAFALMLADAVVRLRLGPLARIGGLAAAAAVFAGLFALRVFADLSIVREYGVRAEVFRREALAHMTLALGSLALAMAVGIPAGVLIARKAGLRAPVLNLLNMVQTIPSIALFGMLIAPLGWIAATVPGASAVGIAGIGMAPAFVALFLYSLLPMVANTFVGITGVSRTVVDAADGMGMTRRQRLMAVELPLALPVILTGVRIVLVQNIGLATIAALIGGGGLGVFVFLGIGQTAPDLILLGAVPTVALAFAAAVVLDALVALTGKAPP